MGMIKFTWSFKKNNGVPGHTSVLTNCETRVGGGQKIRHDRKNDRILCRPVQSRISGKSNEMVDEPLERRV